MATLFDPLLDAVVPNPPLFGRTIKVTAWKAQPTVATLPASFFTQIGNGIEIVDARMSFSIEKHLGSEPNTCTVTINNLAKETRAALCRKPLHIRIDAGYAGVARNLFQGDLRFGASKHNVTDWETKLQLGDGARAYSFARSNRSFTQPVNAREVIRYAASTMNLEVPPAIEQSADLSGALANGISLHGPTRDVLTRLLAPYSLHWSIQNGRLQILKDADIIPGSAYLINEAAGLIGSPDQAAPDKATGRREVTFEVALYPELTPGCQIKLESEDISGTFKLIQITHTGDTHGEDWKSVCKVVPR